MEHGQRVSPGNVAWARCRDLRHGGEPREHHDRRRLLRQGHPRVVLADVRPASCAGGPRRLHHFPSGEKSPSTV